MQAIEQRIESVVETILQDYSLGRDIDKMEQSRQPDKDAVIDMIEKLRRIVFPGYFRDRNYRSYNSRNLLSALIEDTMLQMVKQIGLVFESTGMDKQEAQQQAQQVTVAFFEAIPQVRAMVQTDLQAAYDGDPAATSCDEIIFSIWPNWYDNIRTSLSVCTSVE